MDYTHDLRIKLLLKDEKIRELEGMVLEKDQLIEDLKAKLDKFQVRNLHRGTYKDLLYTSHIAVLRCVIKIVYD